MKRVTIVNFSHPITDEQKAEIGKRLNVNIDNIDIVNIRTQLNIDMGFIPQIEDLLNQANIADKFSSQNEILVFNMPALAIATALVMKRLVEMAGRKEFYLLRLGQVTGAVMTTFVVKELILIGSGDLSPDKDDNPDKDNSPDKDNQSKPEMGKPVPGETDTFTDTTPISISAETDILKSKDGESVLVTNSSMVSSPESDKPTPIKMTTYTPVSAGSAYDGLVSIDGVVYTGYRVDKAGKLIANGWRGTTIPIPSYSKIIPLNFGMIQ